MVVVHLDLDFNVHIVIISCYYAFILWTMLEYYTMAWTDRICGQNNFLKDSFINVYVRIYKIEYDNSGYNHFCLRV